MMGDTTKTIIIFSILVIIIATALVYYLKQNKEGFYQKEGDNKFPLLEITPATECCGGPYMHSTDLETQKMCMELPDKELCTSCCKKGYNGRPIKFEYSTMSNKYFKNTMCDGL